MESLLDYYIENYGKNVPKYRIDYIKKCYENLETIDGRHVFNSIVLIKKYKGEIYCEDISVIYELVNANVNNVSDEYLKSLYENNYLTYDEFVKKYNKFTYVDKTYNTNLFIPYLIDHLQPAPVDIKIALKN